MPIRIRSYRYAPSATILNTFGRIIGYLLIVAGLALLVGSPSESILTGILALVVLGAAGGGCIALTNTLTDKLAKRIVIKKFLTQPEFAKRISQENPQMYHQLAGAAPSAGV